MQKCSCITIVNCINNELYLIKRMLCNLFKFLLDVCVCLQFELSACIWPVHQEEPLLGVDLLHQYGRFLVVPHLQMKCMLYLRVPPLILCQFPCQEYTKKIVLNYHLWPWRSFVKFNKYELPLVLGDHNLITESLHWKRMSSFIRQGESNETHHWVRLQEM